MPGIELHADYDRNGRLTESPAERAARLEWPGAVVVANLDRDQRVLPSRPTSGDTPPPDYDIATAFARDDELLPLRVRVAPGALGTGESLRIRCSGIMHTRVRLSTANGVIVPHQLGTPEEYVLPLVPSSGILDLTLQVRTIAGAAFGQLSNLDVTYRADAQEESRFELTLLRIDAQGGAISEDRGHFSVAPVILDDCTNQVVKLYIVDSGNNLPSVTDVRAAATAAGVPVVVIDPALANGDTWLQDQYQHGVMQGAQRSREIIVHLPRFRHENSIASITDNLEDFVNSHFRSRDIALHTDLWERILQVNTSDGGVLRITFRELRDWVMSAYRLLLVQDRIDDYGLLADPSWRSGASGDWIETLRRLPRNLRHLSEVVDAAANGAPEQRAKYLQGLKQAAKQLVTAATVGYSLKGSGDAASITSRIAATSVSLPVDTANRLYERGFQMHESSNYGGNIESTPAVAGAPLGKVIIGNAVNPDTGSEFVDPDLLRLLAKQKKQPIVEVDTTWLEVGHVDEMMAVVPHRAGFSVVHASAAAAMAILRGAEALYRSGLPRNHPDTIAGPRRPSGILPRLMTEGRHPVTRLFRGKAWSHVHPPPQRGQVSDLLDPPKIYMRLARELGGGGGFNVHGIGMVPGEGSNRRYPADITPSEIIFCELDVAGMSVNDAIDATMLQRSRSTLADALGVPILLVPVLFDRVRSVAAFSEAHWSNKTSAFSPDIANLQVLNGHLLVPKPYGPRMRRDDAIAVVHEAMQVVGMPGAIRDRVGPRLVARRRMTRELYWVERVEPAYLID
jgi:hypothetical protein